MKTRVQRWGNSLAIRIPKAFAEELGLTEGGRVELRLSEGTLVLEPCTRARLDLEELVSRIPADYVPEVIDWGPPVGKEIW